MQVRNKHYMLARLEAFLKKLGTPLKPSVEDALADLREKIVTYDKSLLLKDKLLKEGKAKQATTKMQEFERALHTIEQLRRSGLTLRYNPTHYSSSSSR